MHMNSPYNHEETYKSDCTCGEKKLLFMLDFPQFKLIQEWKKSISKNTIKFDYNKFHLFLSKSFLISIKYYHFNNNFHPPSTRTPQP